MTDSTLQLGASARVSQAGWAWTRTDADGATVEGCGAEAGATAYRARLIAAVDGLMSAPKGVKVRVQTGDALLAQLGSDFIHRWAAKGFKKGDIKDRDLVLRLHALLAEREVVWEIGAPEEAATRARDAAASPPTAGEPPAEKWAPPVELQDGSAIVAWTDGGCRKNPGPGGWGFVMVHAATGTTLLRRGGEADTTNNRMELTSVLKLLESVTRPGVAIEIRADSKYVIDTITKWMQGWKRKGWTRGKDEAGNVLEVKNLDLIKALDEAVRKHKVTFTWVRGHTGDPGNELADRLCNDAMDAVVAGRDADHSERRDAPPFKITRAPGPQK